MFCRVEQNTEGVALQLRARRLSEEGSPPAPPAVQPSPSPGALVPYQRKPGWLVVQLDVHKPWFKALEDGDFMCMFCMKHVKRADGDRHKWREAHPEGYGYKVVEVRS